MSHGSKAFFSDEGDRTEVDILNVGLTRQWCSGSAATEAAKQHHQRHDYEYGGAEQDQEQVGDAHAEYHRDAEAEVECHEDAGKTATHAERITDGAGDA